MESIQKMLLQIEQQQKIKILFAVETGSRAWGFPSPDSDYDVRFIYKHEMEWYLHLGKRKETVEVAIDNDLDITGWDFRKSLQLLKKSNAALIERFQSPIEYFAEPGFKEAFKELIEQYYSPIAVFYHHYSLAGKLWEDLKNANEFKLKSWFYLIRSLLSCSYIVRDNRVLPMHIEGLMVYTHEDRREQLRKLVALKATVTEKYIHSKDASLHQWILELWDFVEASKNKLAVNNRDYSLLDEFFTKTLYAKANN